MVKKTKVFKQNVIKTVGDVTRLFDSRGNCCLLDTYNLKKLEGFYWTKSSNGYWITYRGDFYLTKLHDYLLDHFSDDGFIVDHIDGNTDNHFDSNLRLCSRSDNSCNQRLSKNNTTGVTGVYYNKSRDRYFARIKRKGVERFLGYYSNIEDAIKARKDAEVEHFGEFRRNDLS